MPQINPEDFKRWNEDMASRYDVELFHTHPSPLVRLIARQRIDGVLKFLNAQADEKILEVGCGAGNILEKIPVGQLYGVDLSEQFLEKARKRLGSRATLESANAESLPFADNTFDRVICTEVLEHTLHPDVALREMVRIAKPGATIVVSVPFERNVNLVKMVIKRLGLFDVLFNTGTQGYRIPEKTEESWHLHYFSLKLLRQLIPGDLQQEAIMRVPLFIFPLHYVVRYRLMKKASPSQMA